METQADWRHLNSAKTKWTVDIINSAEMAVKKDDRQTITELVTATGAWKMSGKKDQKWRPGDGVSTGTNAPVRTAAVVQDWLAARGIQVLEYPSFCRTWSPLTSSSPGWRKSWLAATWPRKTSRRRGRGWPLSSPKKTSPPPFGATWLELSKKWVGLGSN